MYALSCVARRLGEQTMFNASIKEEGGGVWAGYSSTFVKTGGTIDATNKAKKGKVAYSSKGQEKRNRTAGPNDNLDSDKKRRPAGGNNTQRCQA